MKDIKLVFFDNDNLITRLEGRKFEKIGAKVTVVKDITELKGNDITAVIINVYDGSGQMIIDKIESNDKAISDNGETLLIREKSSLYW